MLPSCHRNRGIGKDKIYAFTYYNRWTIEKVTTKDTIRKWGTAKKL
jgi:hypothetical protein